MVFSLFIRKFTISLCTFHEQKPSGRQDFLIRFTTSSMGSLSVDILASLKVFISSIYPLEDETYTREARRNVNTNKSTI